MIMLKLIIFVGRFTATLGIRWPLILFQTSEIRTERARLGGRIGGVRAQALNRALGAGRFNSETQRQRGRRGAAVNRERGTGAYDPENLQRANTALNAAIAENPQRYAKQRAQNLERGRQTQREKGVNLGDPLAQRLKSLKYRGVTIENVWYSLDQEQRTYLSETTLDYYLRYAPPRSKKKGN
uniref:Putative HNH homing endonuclease n=1 Tax=Chlorogonium capillatum TaxID=71743 RepID=A0A0S2ICP8_9CHLO|nr:putative HNH homing endonuclease [Chlorogonium capillatum]